MKRKLIYIVTAPLVQSLRNEGLPLPEPPIRFYPDGSLWTDDNQRLLRVGSRNVLECPTSLIGWGGSSFRPLAPFGGAAADSPQYEIHYPGTYDWLGEHENWALTYPGVFQDPREDEYDLSRVHVMVKLRSRFTPAVAEELAAVLRQWFVQIGSQGVFGEAGIKSISTAMHYFGKCAGFEMDARGSGQETLNTLYLAVLNWGITQHRPLVLTDLTANRNDAVYRSDQLITLYEGG